MSIFKISAHRARKWPILKTFASRALTGLCSVTGAGFVQNDRNGKGESPSLFLPAESQRKSKSNTGWPSGQMVETGNARPPPLLPSLHDPFFYFALFTSLASLLSPFLLPFSLPSSLSLLPCFASLPFQNLTFSKFCAIMKSTRKRR